MPKLQKALFAVAILALLIFVTTPLLGNLGIVSYQTAGKWILGAWITAVISLSSLDSLRQTQEKP